MSAVNTVGQRIRCTLGESVLVGTYHGEGPANGWLLVRIDGATGSNAFGPEWGVTRLAEPEPPVGTVVLDCDGDAWQLVPSGWRCIYSDNEMLATLDELAAEWGPLTLLEVAR